VKDTIPLMNPHQTITPLEDVPSSSLSLHPNELFFRYFFMLFAP